MKVIPLSPNGRKYAGLYAAFVDDQDYDFVSALTWNPLVKATTNGAYVRAMRSSKNGSDGWATTFMHRLIFERANGPIQHGMTVDHASHRNFGGLDNTRSNLRLANHSDQAGNRLKRKGCASSYKGVARAYQSKTWVAVLHVAGRNHHLGWFTTAEQAALAYDKEALVVFGEFALLNFPSAVTA